MAMVSPAVEECSSFSHFFSGKELALPQVKGALKRADMVLVENSSDFCETVAFYMDDNKGRGEAFWKKDDFPLRRLVSLGQAGFFAA